MFNINKEIARHICLAQTAGESARKQIHKGGEAICLSTT